MRLFWHVIGRVANSFAEIYAWMSTAANVIWWILMASCQQTSLPHNFIQSHQIKKSACNEWRSASPRVSVWATQLQSNVALVASCWRHRVRFDRPGIRTSDFRTDSIVLLNELTSDLRKYGTVCTPRAGHSQMTVHYTYQSWMTVSEQTTHIDLTLHSSACARRRRPTPMEANCPTNPV